MAGGWSDGDVSVATIPTLDLSRFLGLQLSVTFGGLGRARTYARALRPALLHANGLEFQTSLTAARLRRTTSIPLVLTAHLAGFDAMPQPWRTLGDVHQQTIGRHLLGRADRIIAVSHAVARHVETLGAPSGRVRIVPNGVDHERFRAGPSRGREVRLLFVGRLVPNKGADDAVRAFAGVRRLRGDVSLTVVGDGPQREDLAALARRLGVADGVRFAGWARDVERYLAEADVLLRPTRTEGMPLTVLEAMASGVCILASDVPGNAELIDDGRTGVLVPAGDVRALAAALRRLVDDGAERSRLAGAAREASLGYSWDRCARETLDVFVDAARTPARVAA
jgi:glycosyltransferase involved in cell wall biosynthesis